MKTSQGKGGDLPAEGVGARPVSLPSPRPRVDSRTLLGAGGELVIDHEGREYRLRITQNGKLILTA